jgi:hypothetical protein
MSAPRSRSPSDTTRVTTTPAATETSSAGICATRPSPTVSSEYNSAAAPSDLPCWIVPIASPPTRLTRTTTIDAMASPLTNFIEPSMAP